ncbi:hypothetical protein GAO09_05370 [Rhizobiales bacterium RZME27]|uniref:Uncharacterized protein n=1 Tax=Endobacterium cereale TaxID=2663029 RepID=A0A6A8A9L0_9HYPH|nr:hypothetical protein [Endobacterium cereale]MEB2844686.1 hypothetical protein [Endobacterium cereale]MQY45491.1 hypothetical protein [Endobacterium cereale]
MSKSKPAPVKAKPLFYPFDHTPPSAEACLDAVYEAFDHYTIAAPFCRQCFEPEQERVMLLSRDTRRADAKVFDMIYFEHPNCSGGPDTFWHWLPRGLELSFFGDLGSAPFPQQMIRVGLAALPEQELHALRRLFCRIALNWLQNFDYAPLGVQAEMDDAGLPFWHRQSITVDIFVILIMLRTEPSDVLKVFLDSDRNEAWSVVWELFQQGSFFIEKESYYALDDKADEEPMREAVATLHRRTRTEVFQLVDRPFLLKKWMAASESNSYLADDLADLEALYNVYHNSQTDEERAEDERLMRIGFKLDPPPSS